MINPNTHISTPKAQRTRQKMFDATEQILSREGYAAWNEIYLCELCGCTRGALRYQFPNGRYDIFPAFIEAVIAQDTKMVESLGELTPVERMYLFLMSMRFRPPSPATRAILEISMAARGDALLHARIDPIMESANGRVLGMAAGESDPEMLALRCLLQGASMYSFHKDYTPEGLNKLLGWILQYLPVPPALIARAEEMLHARRVAGTTDSSSET
jgi:AcrR family transcriptional regulator